MRGCAARTSAAKARTDAKDAKSSAQLGDVETAAALLQLGAATGMATTPYSDGSCYYTVGTARTALDYAIQSSSQEMIDLLRAHGAKTAAELTVEAQ